MDSLGKLEFSEKKIHKSNESWDSEQIAKTPADCWSNSVFEFCMFLASLCEFTQFTLPLSSGQFPEAQLPFCTPAWQSP